jgi:hypothetical protein
MPGFTGNSSGQDLFMSAQYNALAAISAKALSMHCEECESLKQADTKVTTFLKSTPTSADGFVFDGARAGKSRAEEVRAVDC